MKVHPETRCCVFAKIVTFLKTRFSSDSKTRKMCEVRTPTFASRLITGFVLGRRPGVLSDRQAQLSRANQPPPTPRKFGELLSSWIPYWSPSHCESDPFVMKLPSRARLVRLLRYCCAHSLVKRILPPLTRMPGTFSRNPALLPWRDPQSVLGLLKMCVSSMR